MAFSNAPLFLLGGSPAYPFYADEFVAAAGGSGARIAVLAQTLAGWKKYQDLITQPWVERGVSQFFPVVPDDSGQLDLPAAQRALQEASAIFICGGSTPVYHRLFASPPLSEFICQRYQAGVPVAGVSAGALIASEFCQLVPAETGEQHTRIVPGLGLATGFVIGVHYSELDALPEVLEVMQLTRTSQAYGVDEPAGVVCQNGIFSHILGHSVYHILMSSFQEPVYRITKLGEKS